MAQRPQPPSSAALVISHHFPNPGLSISLSVRYPHIGLKIPNQGQALGLLILPKRLSMDPASCTTFSPLWV